MKKIFTLAAAALIAGSLVSCDNEGKNEATFKYPAYTFNLFTPLDGSDDYSIQASFYDLTLTTHDMMVETSVSSMPMPGGGILNIKFKSLPFDVYTGGVDGRGAFLYTWSAADASDSGADVKDLSVLFTQSCYIPPTVNGLDMKVSVPGVSNGTIGVSGYPFYYVASYKLNNRWQIRTFWPDQTFKGTSTIQNGGDAYENKEMSYRVVMNTDASGVIGKKADLVLYEVKFSESSAEAMSCMVLKDLDLEFSSKGWKLSGTNVTAQTVQDGKLAADAAYKFDSIDASATGDLTNMSCNYRFNGDSIGSFYGCYMLKPTASTK